MKIHIPARVAVPTTGQFARGRARALLVWMLAFFVGATLTHAPASVSQGPSLDDMEKQLAARRSANKLTEARRAQLRAAADKFIGTWVYEKGWSWHAYFDCDISKHDEIELHITRYDAARGALLGDYIMRQSRQTSYRPQGPVPDTDFYRRRAENLESKCRSDAGESQTTASAVIKIRADSETADGVFIEKSCTGKLCEPLEQLSRVLHLTPDNSIEWSNADNNAIEALIFSRR